MDSGDRTPWFAQTRSALIELGRTSGDPAAKIQRLATHAEVQLVVRLAADLAAESQGKDQGRQQAPVHASIRISRQPCGTEPGISPMQQRLTCDKQLGNLIRRWLPPGSSIVVIDPDEQEWTYPKGAKK